MWLSTLCDHQLSVSEPLDHVVPEADPVYQFFFCLATNPFSLCRCAFYATKQKFCIILLAATLATEEPEPLLASDKMTARFSYDNVRSSSARAIALSDSFRREGRSGSVLAYISRLPGLLASRCQSPSHSHFNSRTQRVTVCLLVNSFAFRRALYQALSISKLRSTLSVRSNLNRSPALVLKRWQVRRTTAMDFRLMVYKMAPAKISDCLTEHFRIQVYAIKKHVSIKGQPINR